MATPEDDNKADDKAKQMRIKALEKYAKTSAPYHDQIVIPGFERRSIFQRDYPSKDRRKP